MCRGGVNAHVLAHEFHHYLKKLRAQPVSEPEAEKFAVRETRGKENVLYSSKPYHKFREVKNVKKPIELLKYWGPQHLGKGIERGLVEIDRITGRAALPPHERPSFYGNLLMTIGGALGLVFAPEPWDLVLAIWGGHHSTKLWDYAEEYAAPAARVVYRPAAPAPRYVAERPYAIPTGATRPTAVPTRRYTPNPKGGRYTPA